MGTLRAMITAEPLFERAAPRRPPLRVAIITETYPPEVNGVAMTIGRMVEGLARLNHHVLLIRPGRRAACRFRSTAICAWACRPEGNWKNGGARGGPISCM